MYSAILTSEVRRVSGSTMSRKCRKRPLKVDWGQRARLMKHDSMRVLTERASNPDLHHRG